MHNCGCRRKRLFELSIYSQRDYTIAGNGLARSGLVLSIFNRDRKGRPYEEYATFIIASELSQSASQSAPFERFNASAFLGNTD